jgi:predicted ATPase
LLRRLSVFAGGWRLEAAEDVCAGGVIERTDVLAHRTRLVDASLVTVDELNGEARYRLLEPVRLYAAEQLAASHEVVETRRARAAAFLEFAEERSTPAFVAGGAYQSTAVRRLDELECEHDNLRAVLRWLMESGQIEHAVRLTAALGELWIARGYFDEGRRWLARQRAGRSGRGVVVPQQGTRSLSLATGCGDRVAGVVDRLGLVRW